jgi:DNA-binding NarL/FixJ family response regulator
MAQQFNTGMTILALCRPNMSRIVLVAREPSPAPAWRGELASIGGHEIVAATPSARSARALVEKHHPDMVVCELTLDDGTAMAMIQWLALQTQRPLIVAATHDEFDPLLFEALKSGADNLCCSGDAPGALAACVGQTLRGETILTSSIARALLDHFERSQARLGHTVDDEASPLQLETAQRELLMKLAVGYRVEQLAQAQQASPRALGQRLRTIVRKMQWDLRAGSLALQLA